MAKKFSFRLESVLKLRTHKVNEAKDALNKIILQRLDKEHQMQDYLLYIENELNKAVPISNVAEMQARYHHKRFIEDVIKQLEYQIMQLKEIENLRRLELQEAMKQEKVLEKLKEKKQAQYKEDMDKEEMNRFDEIAISRFIKTTAENV